MSRKVKYSILKFKSYFNGFNIFTFDWTSDFEYEAIENAKKTKAYLKHKDVHKKSLLESISSFFRLN